MRAKAITLKESIEGLRFGDKDFFLKRCRESFPVSVTVFLLDNKLEAVIPLYLAAIKLKLKGFIVKVAGEDKLSVKRFCKNLALLGMPDVEKAKLEKNAFTVTVHASNSKYGVWREPVSKANEGHIANDYKQFVQKRNLKKIEDVFEDYLKQTKVELGTKFVDVKKANGFRKFFSGADANRLYHFLLEKQPANLFSSNECCRRLRYSISRYLRAIKKLLALNLIERKGDIFIPKYKEILLVKNDSKTVSKKLFP